MERRRTATFGEIRDENLALRARPEPHSFTPGRESNPISLLYGTEPQSQRRVAMLEELQGFCRRAAVLPLSVPLLLLIGAGLGRVTAAAVALPEDVVVHPATDHGVDPDRLERLSQHMSDLRSDGQRTADYVVLYRHHVAPVERTLLRRGVPASTARRVAWPLVEHSYRRGLDPATVVSVLLVESSGRPRATSPVGARGLMQVMPAHRGRWDGCGSDLYDIDENLCYGTAILAWYLNRFRGDERRALLGYNGCVRGTNTPNCFRYPDRVQRLRQQIRSEWANGGHPVARTTGGPAAPAAAAP